MNPYYTKLTALIISRNKLLGVLLLVLLNATAFAQSTSWRGTSSTNWHTASNWTNGVPTSTVNAIIGDGSFTSWRMPTISYAASCKSLTIGGTKASTLTVNSNLTVAGNVTINSNGALNHNGNSTISLTGNWTKNGNYTATANYYGTPQVTFAGSVQSLGGSSITSFNRMTINANTTVSMTNNASIATLTLNGIINPGSSLVTIGAAYLNPTGTIRINAATYEGNYLITNYNAIYMQAGFTVEYSSSTVDQTITNLLYYSTLKISGTTVKRAPAALYFLGSTAALGNIIVASGTLDLGIYQAARIGTAYPYTPVLGGIVSVANGATLRMAGTTTLPTGFQTYTFNPSSTVEFYGAAQSIDAKTYGNLVLSNAGTKTAAGSLNINGSLAINGGATFAAGAHNHAVAGDWLVNSGSFSTTGTITFDGTNDQDVKVGSNFTRVTVNKASGKIDLLSDMTITTSLTFTKGQIATGANEVIIPSTGAISGASATTGWVNGRLQKYIPNTTTTVTFEIGGNQHYSYLTFKPTAGLTPGYLIAGVKPSAHPNIGTSTMKAKNISRYWTLTKPVSTPVAYSKADVYFNWNAADNYTLINGGALVAQMWNGSSWSGTTENGTSTTVRLGIRNLAATGDFAIGEAAACTVSSGFHYANTVFCSNAGVVGVTMNTGATKGTFTASPAGLSLNASTGDITLASSTPGTYTVTNTATGSCTSTSSFTVTITAAPTATISYGATSLCQSGSVKNVTITGTTGGTFTATDGLDIDATSGAITPANSDPGTYTVTYTINAASGCNAFSTTAQVTITEAATALINYTDNPYCKSIGGTATIDLTGTTGGAFSATPTGLSLNASTGAVIVGTSTAGTYKVVYTIPAGNGCATYRDTAEIIIHASPVATISYAGQPYFATGTKNVTLTGTTGGFFEATEGLAIDEVTGQLLLDSSLAGTYTVSYNGVGCPATTTVIVKSSGTWTGAVSTAWDVNGNWEGNRMPTLMDNVTITAGKARYPVLGAGKMTEVTNVTIATGGSLTINGILKVRGSLTAPAKSITATNGTLELKGATNQDLGGIFANELGNLTINNNVSVTLTDSVKINGILSLDKGTLYTNDYLVLKSNAQTTARVSAIPVTNANPIVGKVTVERYVAGRRKYRLITSSVTTSPKATLSAGEEHLSIWGNWQNGGVASPMMGTIITGGTAADGFDQATTNPSVYTYNSATRMFTAFTSTNGKQTKYTPLKAGHPYYMFVYGDRLNSATSSNPNPTVLRSTGTLLTGTQVYNTTSALPISPVVGQYTLIGNPFACTIDWKSVQKSMGVSKTIWGWDANLSNTGGYVTVTETLLGALISPISNLLAVNRYVQPGQAFFVQTIGANPVIQIREIDKINDLTAINSQVFRTTGDEQPLMAVNLIVDNGTTKTLYDGAVTAFDQTFDNALTNDDGKKMVGTTEGVAFNVDNDLLSINTRQWPVNDDTLKLNITRLARPQYTLQVFATGMASSNLQAYLYDSYMNTTTPLSLTDTNNIRFSISMSNAASKKEDRFSIIFKSIITLPVSFTKVAATRVNDTDAEVSWTVASDDAAKIYIVERSGDGITYRNAGEVSARGEATVQTYRLTDRNLAEGRYYYRVKAVYADGQSNYSKVVNVTIEKGDHSIRVTPNPIKDHNVSIHFSQFEKGEYHISVVNVQGQKIAAQVVKLQGGAETIQLSLNKNHPAGTYYLRISGPGTEHKQTLVVQ